MATTEEIFSDPEQDGYFNPVADVFARHGHPIIVVEESAFRWMGVRYLPTMDCDLLVRDNQIAAITAALLGTGDYTIIAQGIRSGMPDPLVAHVMRLRYTGELPLPYTALSLWSETDYQLSVDDATVAVPDLCPVNVTVAEAHFDPGKPGVAEPLTFEARYKRGLRVVPRTRALTTNASSSSSPHSPDAYSIYIPTIPRMVEAQLRQHHRRVIYYAKQERDGDSAVGLMASLPMYHVECMVRYLYLEKDHQRQKLLPELAPEFLGALEKFLNKHVRKPVITAENIANLPPCLKGKQRKLLASRAAV